MYLQVIDSVVRIETVTVNPLCPTNKIAPHKRVPRYENNNLRTFGAYYDLLAPGNTHHPPSSLQEEPQSDDPNDCGEIEDYDENDLSSITSQSLRRQGLESNSFFFSWLQQLYANGIKPTPTPVQTPPHYIPTRVPAGGYLGSNFYTPPKPQEPTNNLKPVNEAGGDQQNIVYRPGIVGGPSGHIVGLPQAMIKPISDSSRNKNRNIKHNHVHASATHDHAQTNSHIQKPNRGRKLNSNGILSSFLDLLH
ncbi:unnamed protein product, partial [Brenthis ino]